MRQKTSERDMTVWRALAACALVLLLSVAAAVYALREEQREREARFQNEVNRQQAEIVWRLQAYEQLLRGAAGLFAASTEVNRAAWRTYIDSLNLRERFPGLETMVYAEWLTDRTRERHVARLRAEGFEHYAIHPEGRRDAYATVIYTTPTHLLATKALGYDMYSEPTRRQVMDRARGTGEILLSGRVQLVTDAPGSSPATLMSLPIYHKDMPHTSTIEREAAIAGFIHASLRVPDLIDTLPSAGTSGVLLNLRDANGDLLYDSDRDRSAIATRITPIESTLSVYGRDWMLRYEASAAFGAHETSTAPYVIIGGLLLSALLFALLRSAETAEARARSLAGSMTQALRESEASHRAVVESSAEGILTIDPRGIVLSFNRAAEHMFGFVASDVIGNNVSMLMPARYRARHDALVANFDRAAANRILGLRREVIGLRRDGQEFPMSLAINVIEGPGPRRLVVVVGDISERKRQEEYIRHIAQHDALTQLPNRTLLQHRLELAIARARREQAIIGVLMLDLDQFKRINDSLGHDVGDQVLLGVARRLRSCVRESDTVARMGGDEFVVLLEDLRSVERVQRIARDIVLAFVPPFHIGPHELHVSASIGVSCYPLDGEDVASLLKNADTAMYHAKASGRANHQMFSAEMQRRANEKLALESAMRHALTRGEFTMHYEPQVSLKDGEVVGVEALIRWCHPERGMVPPSEFIPVAEETGLIVPIGEWTLRTACVEARLLQQRLGRPISVAVNLSPRQFAQPNLLGVVREACSVAGLDPHRLVLEITEGMLVIKPDETVHLLQGLRAMGVRVAIDDFGTGYSSLSYLTRFPVDLLKIDRSFVRDLLDDPADAAVASAIIAMAHELGIAVVAEGVETVEQLTMLHDRHCDIAQGYFIGRGAPASRFEERSLRDALPLKPGRDTAAVVADAVGEWF